MVLIQGGPCRQGWPPWLPSRCLPAAQNLPLSSHACTTHGYVVAGLKDEATGRDRGGQCRSRGPRGCCRHPGRSSYMVLVGKPLPSMRVPQQAAAPLRRRGRGAKRHARTSSPSWQPGNGPAHNFCGAKTCFGNPEYNGEQFGCMLQGARTHACALDTHAECGGGRTRVLQGRVLRGSPNTYYKCSLFILRASTSSPYCCSILSQARGECGRPRS